MQTSGTNRHFEELKDMTTQISLTPCVILPPDVSLQLTTISVVLFNILSISLCLCVRLDRYLSSLCLIYFNFALCCLSFFLSLCSTESNSDRPSPTGLCWRPALRRWAVSPTFTTPSLPPSVPLPLPSPIRFVTSAGTWQVAIARWLASFLLD